MIPEHLSPDRFAAAVATRLNSVVPAGLSVRAEGAGVTLYDPQSWGASLAADFLADEDGRSIVERVETVAYAIMNSVQDEVMESTKEQWPVRHLPMAIRSIGSFLDYWRTIRGRTRRVVACIPPDRIEWRPHPGKLIFGDLVRHLAAIER